MKTAIRRFALWIPLFACLAGVQGCASVGQPGAASTASPPQQRVPRNQQQPASVGRTQKPSQSEETETPIQVYRRVDPDAIIVLSNDTPGYLEIAEQLNALLDEPARVYLLSDDALLDKAIVAQIEISSSRQLVAVGLAAARAVRGLSDRQVVFCEVANYADYDLVSANMKGVVALPSPDKLFADWKRLSPGLNRVLVVTGTGFEDYIAEAQSAARLNRIRLTHEVVESGSEFLDAVRRDPGAHQGQWILQDDGVLDSETLRQALAFNNRQGVQSVVYSAELLALGGLFYAAPAKGDISRKVIERFRQSRSSRRIDGEGVIELRGHEMGINARVASRLGVTIPVDLRRYLLPD